MSDHLRDMLRKKMQLQSDNQSGGGPEEEPAPDVSEGSEEEESDASDEIDVIEPIEDIDYERDIIINKLSKIGNRSVIWTSKFSSYFVISAYIISLETVLYCAANLDHHGLSFVIAYPITTLLIGFPLMYMELALGQFSSSGIFTIFRRICPGLAGFGVVSLIVNFLSLAADSILAIHFMQIFSQAINPFSIQYIWSTCTSPSDSEFCRQANFDCSEIERRRGIDDYKFDETFRQQYGEQSGLKFYSVGDTCFRSVIPAIGKRFQASGDFFQHDPMKNFLFPNMIMGENKYPYYPTKLVFIAASAVWLMVLYVAHKRRTSLVWLSKLSICLSSALSIWLAGHLFSINEVYVDIFGFRETGTVFDRRLWIDATLLTLRALKIGQGGLPYLGAHNHFRNNLFEDCILLFFTAVATPVIIAVLVLAIMDTYKMTLVSHNYEDFKKLHDDQKDLRFSNAIMVTVLMECMKTYGHMGPAAMLGFAIVSLSFIITNKCIRIDILSTAVIEFEQSFNDPTARGVIVNQIAAVTSLFTMLLLSRDGFTITEGLEGVTAPTIATVVAIGEIFVIVFLYGTRRFFVNISAMNPIAESQQKLYNFINLAIALIWIGIGPALITLLIAYVRAEVTDNDKVDEIGYFFLALCICAIIPIMCTDKILDQTRNGQYWALFKADSVMWGPRSAIDREKNERMERRLQPLVRTDVLRKMIRTKFGF